MIRPTTVGLERTVWILVTFTWMGIWFSPGKAEVCSMEILPAVALTWLVRVLALNPNWPLVLPNMPFRL